MPAVTLSTITEDAWDARCDCEVAVAYLQQFEKAPELDNAIDALRTARMNLEDAHGWLKAWMQC